MPPVSEAEAGIFFGGPLDGQPASWALASVAVSVGPSVTMTAPWIQAEENRIRAAMYVSQKFVWRTQNGWRMARGMLLSDSFHVEVERVSTILKFLSRLWGVPPDGEPGENWCPLMNRDVILALRDTNPGVEWWGNYDWSPGCPDFDAVFTGLNLDEHRCDASDSEVEAEIAAWREILDGAKRPSKRSKSGGKVSPD